LFALTRYIHLNPIKTAACRRLSRQQRVRRLESYRWSSYPGYVAAGKKMESVCYDLLQDYGRTLAAGRKMYRAYVRACILEDDGPILEALAASRYAIGDSAFVEKAERQLTRRRSGRAQDADLALPRPTIASVRIDARVAAEFGVKPEDLRAHGHHGGTAKFAAVELACRLTGLTQRAVGDLHGGISSAAVSIIRRKIRTGEYPLASIVERLQQELTEDIEEQT
jgi:hypothetical protein